MKRLIAKILLIIIQKLLQITQRIAGSQISDISFTAHDHYLDFEVQFWDRPSIFKWREYKSCNYKDQLTENIKITYWDIEKYYNTVEGINYE